MSLMFAMWLFRPEVGLQSPAAVTDSGVGFLISEEAMKEKTKPGAEG